MKSTYISKDIIAFLQDNKKHTISELCNEVEISRSTALKHLNELSMHYNIQTFVGRYGGGIRLIDKKVDVNYLSDDDLQLIIKQLGLLQDPNSNIKKFVRSLSSHLEEKEQEYGK